MSGIEVPVDAVRDGARELGAQATPREWAGALLVVLQLVVWRYPAAEPAQLVRASLGRPMLLMAAVAERTAEAVWALLGPLALVVPGLVAALLLDLGVQALRPHLPRLVVGAAGTALLLEALGGEKSAWLSGGLLGGVAVGLFAQLLVSELWGAGLAALLGGAGIGWASGLADWLRRRAPALGWAAGELGGRARPAVEQAAHATARALSCGVQWIESRQPAAPRAAEPERDATEPHSPSTPSGTAIEGAGGGAR